MHPLFSLEKVKLGWWFTISEKSLPGWSEIFILEEKGFILLAGGVIILGGRIT